MNEIFSYHPYGDRHLALQFLPLGRNLLRIAEENRTDLDIDFHPIYKELDLGPGKRVRILSTASRYGNHRIEIEALGSEEEDIITRRVRLLHCWIELTLFDDDLKYEKDPSFIVVEPLAKTEERKVCVHTTFAIDARTGVVFKGLNDLNDPDNPDFDMNDVSFADAEKIIVKNGWDLCEKKIEKGFMDQPVIDPETGEPKEVKLFPFKESRLTEGPAICKSDETEDITATEFNKFEDIDIWEYTPISDTGVYESETEIDKYQYHIKSGAAQWVQPYTTNANGVATLIKSNVEPLSVAEYELFIPPPPTPDDPNYFDYEPPEEVDIPLILASANYYDSIELDETPEPAPGDLDLDEGPTNIHPLGNLNEANLRYSYGLVSTIRSPFHAILSDFVPRTEDKVPLWDIGRSATRNKTFSFTQLLVDSETGDQKVEHTYPEVSLLVSLFPYCIEMKDAKEIRELFDEDEVDWNFYGRDIAKYSMSGALGSSFYLPWSCNWLLHPFRNKTWAESLADFYSYERGTTEQENNQWWAENNLFEESHTAISGTVDDSGCVYCDPPNRLILCVRSFFANTEHATDFDGIRKSYNVEYPLTDDNGKIGHRCWDNICCDDFEEIPTETSPPLDNTNCPQFLTVQSDMVIVNLLSTLYAVSNYDEIALEDLYLSPRRVELYGDIPLLEEAPDGAESVIGKRPWPKYLDGDWGYTNIYGAGITVDYLGSGRGRYASKDTKNRDAIMNGMLPHKYAERLTRGESIYSDADEDLSKRYIEDEKAMAEVSWRPEDTPESHLIHCIYRALKAKEFDIHHPIADIKIKANLYDRYE